ncbi:MAG: hypothetical protein UR39_C0003G0029 [Candidatus Woesebacteria bacterium GW2011_GWA1_33_30]|uniref:Uncharacterized protein n=1 Tax=Candidatus Woesebacteria bacterium GW2011_GWA2_33_28 TaxID=1618561 RepID=A0A0G0A8P1_9BACT|nr:MAG: hypothetical protein UR38_C0003G0031 [Candidatus Woesebacteria bacterium GW2011_GWA2_33_28]KKP48494.1 MAG: hypothetical protein UR39_C0003G0029 [Candidatus Woesebacteria bacterium GW2011_GWA1_33_30]KKP49632.1 MAG: hypothetical protein UR40_C0004G0031 [Microgenomates group bacterium GW2011_GWC1_33_32]KKP52249.1 MAG: hypothetical protein UR44_C0003G0031 [Candidatus Woesebacteria bacterium GW2011_GWB1_33_38]KKP58084.1 MAG: hypothetical protein UR48_C0008G0017 [Microgenomates group bacteriu
MKAEIDQSGKVEHLNTHTVVSLANHVSGSVYLSATEKIKLIKILRKSIFNRAEFIYKIFAIIVAILKLGKKRNRALSASPPAFTHGVRLVLGLL